MPPCACWRQPCAQSNCLGYRSSCNVGNVIQGSIIRIIRQVSVQRYQFLSGRSPTFRKQGKVRFGEDNRIKPQIPPFSLLASSAGFWFNPGPTLRQHNVSIIAGIMIKSTVIAIIFKGASKWLDLQAYFRILLTGMFA